MINNYAVFLEGNNFNLTIDGHSDLFGFFITVRVEAESEVEAKKAAIRRVEEDPKLEEDFKG